MSAWMPWTEAFHRITGHDRLNDVLSGLERAQALPLNAVKVNAVLLRDGLDEDFRPGPGLSASVRFPYGSSS